MGSLYLLISSTYVTEAISHLAMALQVIIEPSGSTFQQ